SPILPLGEPTVATGVIATLRLLFARQAKGKRKLVLTGFDKTARPVVPCHSLKGCHLCLLSAKSTRRNPSLGAPGYLLVDVSKQQVARVDAEGHLNAIVGWSEHSSPLSGSLKLSQPI